MASYSVDKYINSVKAYTLTLTLTEKSISSGKATLNYDLSLTSYDANFDGYYLGYYIKVGSTTLATLDVEDSAKWSIGKNTTKTIVSGSKEITQGTNLKVSAGIDMSGTASYIPGDMAVDGVFSTSLSTYTISYNANGGSGAPSKQTKTYGKSLTLSSTKPTRTGYTFQGWSTSNDSSVEYDPGDTYTTNASTTLYAVWKANTYSVKYNANGGDGAPSAQTKTYGVTLKLSSTIPTRKNYIFLGWDTSPSANDVKYEAGANYTNNSAVTLYAVWKIAYNGYVNVNGIMKRGLFWIKDDGAWKKGIPWVKKDGVWKRGGA